jgi:hypothetical protein
MKRLLLVTLFVATSAAANDCALLRELYGVRAMSMKAYASSYDIDSYIDKRLDRLREGYVIWARPGGEGKFDKKLHRTKAPKDALDSFEASGEHVYAVRVAVPEKRTVFYGNNPVYVGNIEIRYTAGGVTKTMKQPIETLMRPDTSRTIDLPVIADSAGVRLGTGTDKPGEALVEVHFLQAVAQDDPRNPALDSVRALQRVRDASDTPRAIDDEIAELDRDELPLAEIVADLRRADELIRSKKEDDQDRGYRLLKDTMQRLR